MPLISGILLFLLIKSLEACKEKKNKPSALPESFKNIRPQLKLLTVTHKIYSDILAKLIKKIAVGSKIIELCVFSDNLIYE